MNITINEPCHENWDAMMPHKQGAFCKSCQKNVVDFSKKTIEEIKNFFSKPQEGRVCGRFEGSQLSELSFDDFFSRFRYWSFSKKFAIIFFLSFGFWLFSNQAMAQSDRHLKGEVAYFEPTVQKKDTTKKHVNGQTVIKQTPIMGKIKCTKPEPVQKTPLKETPVIEPQKIEVEKIQVMGMVVYRKPEEKKEIRMPEVPKKVEPVSKPLTIKLVEEEKTAPNNDHRAVELNESKVIVFPNPNNGHFMVETKEKQTLHLFDENGRLVLSQEVNGSTQVNAADLKSGIYTVSLTGAASPTVKKIIITR